MTDKTLSEKEIRLVMEEAKITCFMAKGRDKNNEETSSVASSFSKYIWSLKSLINEVNFDVFANNLFSEVNSYLLGTQDYGSTINNILQQKRAFAEKFLV